MVLLFENNQIITASSIMILTYEMTMKERFNMIRLSESISRVLVILVKFSLASILIGLYRQKFSRSDVWKNRENKNGKNI